MTRFTEALGRAARKALQYATIIRIEDDGGVNRLLTEDMTSASLASEIESITAKIIRTRKPLFDRKAHPVTNQRRFVRTKLGEGFLLAMQRGVEQVRLSFPTHKLHPFLELFEKHTAGISYLYQPFGEADFDTLNACIAAMREEARTPEFRRRRDAHIKLVRNNTASLIGYIDALFARWSRLLVVRLDVGYQQMYCDHFAVAGRAVTAQQVRRDRDAFLRYLRTECPVKIRGFAWKLEYATLKSYHLHFLLFFDGNQSREGITIGKILGELWRDRITAGKGTYYNCKPDDYVRRGIGLIHWIDPEFAILKEDVAPYLTKPNFLIRLGMPKGRTFGRGVVPELANNKPGRPRTRAAA